MSNKKVEWSSDMTNWFTQVVWSEEESVQLWTELQEHIQRLQIFGFFRLVDTEEEVTAEDTVYPGSPTTT